MLERQYLWTVPLRYHIYFITSFSIPVTQSRLFLDLPKVSVAVPNEEAFWLIKSNTTSKLFEIISHGRTNDIYNGNLHQMRPHTYAADPALMGGDSPLRKTRMC